MFEDYLQASTGQLLLRAKGLNGDLSKPLAAEFNALWQKCSEFINSVIWRLNELLSDPRYKLPAAGPELLRAYRRVIADLDLVENVTFAALKRVNEEDLRMTRLVAEIAQEVLFKLPPPAVSCQSQGYFQAYPHFNLMSVPQKESDFLLHLPDLYHELAHFVLLAENNPSVEPFQRAHDKAMAAALQHIYAMRQKPTRGPSDDLTTRTWEYCWVRSWATEFFCDLFGTCASGPAYGWAHLHLCMKRGGDPFVLQQSHPPDEARMFVILEALTSLGFQSEAGDIEQRWKEMLTLGTYTTNSDYERCFPKILLCPLAQHGVTGYQTMGCRSASLQVGLRVYSALNEAWTRFWKEPTAFPQWERDAVAALMGRSP